MVFYKTIVYPSGPISYETPAAQQAFLDAFITFETANRSPQGHVYAFVEQSNFGVLTPYLKFVVAKALQARFVRRVAAKTRALKRQQHAERQAAWFAGGRSAHYLKKYPYGSSHGWFLRQLNLITGCAYESTIPMAWTPCESENVWAAEAESPLWEEAVEEQASFLPCVRVRKNRVFKEPELAPFVCENREPEPVPTRSIMLLTKLKYLIKNLRNFTYSLINTPIFDGIPALPIFEHKPIYNLHCAPPQSELSGAHGDPIGTVESHNVTLTEKNPGSTSIASNPTFRYDWHKLCSTEQTADYSNLTDRWTFFKSVTWDNQMKSNTPIKELCAKLPVDFIDSVSDKCSMPMFIPFRIHQYFSSDIEIKIHINSNKFQTGQLQFSWQYMEQYDGNNFDNIYSRSQLPHVLVNAGSSNEATLTIPFKYVQPFMLSGPRPNSLSHLYLGSLVCMVVVPLRAGSTGPDNCNVSVFMRFPNAKFTGMRDGSIGQPQMMAAGAAMIAAKAYDQYIGDRNCDNPSVNVNPPVLVPTASHNWSAGTGLRDKVQSLRLDNSTIGVGRDGIDNSETSIGIPCRTFGMLPHITWSSTDKSKNVPGHQLWYCDAHAQLSKSSVFKRDAENGLDVYALPPVSVVASLYKQWRGSLEFKFDIIASQFHTGRLMCAYIPNFYGDPSVITMAQARNSSYVEFSLQDATSFVFTVPYEINEPFWARKYTGPHKYGEFTSPSVVVMYIINPLVPMPSVSPSLTIVPYFRAGPDFEVAVPVQPSIGLSDNITNTVAIKDLIYPTTGSYPYYCTNYSGFGDGKKYLLYEGSSAFGTASTFHAPERKFTSDEYYTGKSKNTSYQATMTYTSFLPDESGQRPRKTAYVGNIVLIAVQDKGNYGIPFPANEEGEKYAKIVSKQFRDKKPMSEILVNCYDYIVDGAPSSKDLDKLQFEPMIYSTKKPDFEFVAYPQADERVETENVLTATSLLPSTSAGRFPYNESFDDLMTLCRRYQLYCDKRVLVPKETVMADPIAIFPVIPSGLDLDVSNPNTLFNNCRDGHIPIICSSYIYFRGSIRFRIVLSSDDFALMGSKIWVQHHPDGDWRGRKIDIYPNILLEDGFKSHSYGFYIQAMNVNSILEFEVPFYQTGMYGLTRQPAATNNSAVNSYYSLGNIVVGLDSGKLQKSVDFNMQVYYSVSDDFSLSCFRGFPLMVFTDEVWPASKLLRKTHTFEIVPSYVTEADPQMFSFFKNNVLGDSVSGLGKEFAQGVKEELLDSLKEIRDVSKDGPVLPAFNKTILLYVSNITHACVNRDKRSVALCITTILLDLINNGSASFVDMVNCFTSLLNYYWHLFDTESSVTEAFIQSPSSGPDPITPVCSMIFSLVASAFGVAISGPAKLPDILRNINSGVSLVNNVMRLLDNCGDLIKYCVKYVLGYIDPKYKLAKFYEEVPEIKSWYTECSYLLDVRNKEKYLFDRSFVARVFDACVTGSIIVSNGLEKSMPGGRIICDTFKEINQLKTDLIERGVHPDVRFEPYPLWICGGPGIGKSFFVNKLSTDLLKSVNYVHKGSLIYTVKSGAKYWDCCENPAVLVSDDIFQVKDRFPDELANLFAICSNCVLNPPMAAVEDKQKRINPLLYLMLSNISHPELSDQVTCSEAVYRRRRFLVEAQFADHITAKYNNLRAADQLSTEERENLGHLKFRYAFNVKDPSTEYCDWMTYQELLVIIQRDFASHYKQERQNFKTRMCEMYCMDPDFNPENVVDRIPELQDIMSLADQRAFMRQRIEDEIDALEDPSVPACFRRKIGLLYAKTVKFCLGRPQGPEETDNDLLPKHLADRLGSCMTLDEIFEIDTSGMDAARAAKLNIAHSSIAQQYPDLYRRTYQAMVKAHLTLKDNVTFAVKSVNVQNSPYLTCFLYMGRLISDQTTLEIVLNQVVDKVLFSKEHFSASWIKAEVSKFFEVGSFSTWELLQFVGSFKFGGLLIADLLYGEDPISSVENVGLNIQNTADPISGWVNSTSFKAYLSQKKDSLRESFRNVNLNTNHAAYSEFFVVSAKHFVTNLPEGLSPDMTIIRNFFIDCNDAKDYLAGIHNYFVAYGLLVTAKKTPADILNKLYALGYRFLSAWIIGNSLFRPQHKCIVRSHFVTAASAGSAARYCSVYNKLLVNNVQIHKCYDKTCIFSNDVLYYLLCFSATSCKNSLYMKDGHVIRYEFTDIGRALRKRHLSSVHDDMFDKLAKWCKHFMFHNLPNIISKALNFFLKIAPFLSACVLALGIFKGAPAPALPVPPVVTPQSNYFKFEHPKAVKSKPKVIATHTVAPAQSADRVTIKNRIERNSVLLVISYYQEGKFKTSHVRCLMIAGRVLLVLRHYLEDWKYVQQECGPVQIDICFNQNKSISSASLDFNYLVENVAWCSSSPDVITSNFGLIVLPTFVPCFKSIVPFLALQAQHVNPPALGDIYVINGTNSFDLRLKMVENFRVAPTSTTSSVFCSSVYSYNVQFPGMCGSVLVSNKLGNGNGAILGIHIAGSAASGIGYAEPIWQEMFQEFLGLMPQPEPLMPPLISLDNSKVELDANLMLYGCVPDTFAHKESGKSKIVPSLLSNKIYPVKTEINPLRPNDPRQPPGSDPLRDGCVKHGSGKVKIYDTSLVEEVEQHLKEMLPQIIQPVRVKVQPLTLQQAVCGDVDVPYFEAINWKSSEGFPLSSQRPKGVHDKRWLFDLSEGKFGYKLNSLHPKLEQQMKLRDACFEGNIVPPTVYIDCLKDYRLSPEKCKIPGKTRIFSIAPIQCSLDIRTYINDFCASLKSSRIRNSIAIGINPDSMEWSFLVYYLFEAGDKIITLDYKNFGPSLMSQLVVAGNEVIKEWHRYHGASPDHVRRVEWLLDNDIVNPMHLCKNLVYQTLNGIASGSPLTGECNSIPNIFYIRLTYLEIMKEHFPDYASMFWFDKLVRLVVYGDDLIMSVNNCIAPIFNAVSIRDYLSKHGIDVTSAQKDAELAPYTSIYEATFLKRSFREHPTRPGIWLAPIDTKSIEECLNWCHVSDSIEEATLECCRASLDLAYSQGPEYYHQHYTKIKKALNSLNLVIDYKPWHQRDKEIFDEAESLLDRNKICIDLPWYYDIPSVVLKCNLKPPLDIV